MRQWKPCPALQKRKTGFALDYLGSVALTGSWQVLIQSFLAKCRESEENRGRYTARSEHIRMYFINENGDKAGHIHDIRLEENANLYWPNC